MWSNGEAQTNHRSSYLHVNVLYEQFGKNTPREQTPTHTNPPLDLSIP